MANSYYSKTQKSLKDIVKSCGDNDPENTVKALIRLGQDIGSCHIANPDNLDDSKPDANHFEEMIIKLVHSDWLTEEQSKMFASHLLPGGVLYNTMLTIEYLKGNKYVKEEGVQNIPKETQPTPATGDTFNSNQLTRFC